ncbi:hypothetical protein SAMN04487954_12163 [Billgrantia gudaonensis]|uniref:Uncharacterized protein n=1 Tax=Billgrantia gudaonensis TaxID=376427 RepID=A0A1G9DGY0_9GAMM|nr:hypothetical protein SAMN04487954_12163 [Halomonas gudaonensis]
MANKVEVFPTVWDHSSSWLPDAKPFLRRFWKGLMRLSEAQCQAQARRGFLPYE